MSIITIVTLFIILFFSLKLSKSILHPATITSLLWFVLLIIYNVVDHGLYELSDKFYIALLLWTVPFCCISLFVSSYKYQFPSILASASPNISVRIIYPLMFVFVAIAIYGLYLKGLHYNSNNFFSGIRAAAVATLNGEEDSFRPPFYIRISTMFASYALITMLAIWNKKKKLAPYILFILLVFVFYLFRSNKTVIAQLCLSILCFYLFYNKLTKKVIFVFGVLLVLLLFASHLLRSNDSSSFDLIEFLSVYLLSPLPAFDSVLNSNYNYIYSFNGEFTFRFFVPYLQMLGLNVVENPDSFNLYNWTYTPVPVNVYTIMFSFFVDFGYKGIFYFSIILGSVFGLIYKLASQGYVICRIWYSILFYILVFQFFSDYFFQFLGAHIAELLFTILIFCTFKKSYCGTRDINYNCKL